VHVGDAMNITRKQLRRLIREAILAEDVNEGIFDSMFGGGKKKKEQEERRKSAEETLARLKRAREQGQSSMDYFRQKRESDPDYQMRKLIDDTDDMIDQIQSQETKEERLARLRRELQRRRGGYYNPRN
jgi:hypothetical protein